MSDVKFNDAQERCAQMALFPEYITTLGTELCLLPHLIRFSEAVVEECEQEILMDMGINEVASHPQYSEGFDDGLRHAAKAIRRLFDIQNG